MDGVEKVYAISGYFGNRFQERIFKTSAEEQVILVSQTLQL